MKQYFDNGGQILFIARAYKPQGAGITDAKNYRMLQLASGSAARLRATAPKGTTYAFITASRGFVEVHPCSFAILSPARRRRRSRPSTTER